MTQPTALALSGIEKTYGATRALAGVDFSVDRGEIHVLLGQNGSGKSTLMKVAYGETQPDRGAIAVQGQPRQFRTPQDAVSAGVVMVPQEVPLVAELSVAENISLGRMRRRGARLDRSGADEIARRVLRQLRVDLDPARAVGSLVPFERQMVAIARALALKGEVLILDEPTSSLSVEHANDLFAVLRGLRADGIAMILITQKLKEVPAIADRVTILRDGELVGHYEDDLVDLPIDQLVGAANVTERRHRVVGEDPATTLSVRGMTGAVLKDISFDVRPGEVVGIAGLAGCGREELLRALFGLRTIGGELQLQGKPYAPRTPAAAIGAGVAYVTGDRRGEGLYLQRSVRENLMTVARRRNRLHQIRHRAESRKVADIIRDLRIKTPSDETPVGTLSGGNQQKVVLGKWLLSDPGLLLLDEPTRGVDVAAKQDFYRVIEGLADRGLSVLIGSLDNRELLETCDRILVLHEGRIAADLDGRTATENDIVHYASGLRSEQ